MAQLFINSLISASTIMLVAIGFQIVYRVSRFFNFAHGAIVPCGAYFMFGFAQSGMHLGVSIVLSVGFCFFLGLLLHFVILGPLLKRSSSSIPLILSSLGIYIVIQNTISLFFGDEPRSIVIGNSSQSIQIFDAFITPAQLVNLSISILLIISVSAFFKVSKTGKIFRAISNDYTLALSCGIRSDFYMTLASGMGSALGGIAGILMTFEIAITPLMGLNALLMGVVAIIVGGMESIIGLIFGSLLLGAALNLGVWKIGSQWQASIAFCILIIFVLFKPDGFLGKNSGKS